jgi:2-polyprenyl-3-methyl-5-hydroxy-6-metoxy-1,4-benzoquinol methylase
MSEFQIPQCPVCNKESFSHYLTTTDFFVSGEQFEIKHCNTCGLKFTSNAKDEEHSGQYYQSDDYISHSNTGKGIVNTIYHLVRKYMLGRKRKLVEKVTGCKKGRILDVGSGTGFFLNEMKKHGWEVTGTEKSPEARGFVKKKFNLSVYPANELFNFDDQGYDVITLWHVLEHIHQLNENMEAYFRKLKPNGKLVVAVPNWTSFDGRYYRKNWAAWDVPRHLWHFANYSMERLGNKYGFNIEGLYNMPFDSFYVSILSEKNRKAKFPLLRGLIVGKISWLVSLTGKGRGSSVIYVFDKNR